MKNQAQSQRKHVQEVDYQKMYLALFQDVSTALFFLQKRDGPSLERAELILKTAQCKTEEIYICAE